MIKQISFNIELRKILVFVLVFSCVQFASSQTKKEKVRIKADYIKVMNDASYIDISVSARVNKQNIDVSDAEVIVFNETDDESVELGKISTDMHGKAKFKIEDLEHIPVDSSKFRNFKVSFKGNDMFSKASRSISVQDAKIETNIVTKDSTNFVKATLFDGVNDSLISGQILEVQVQRLFKSLKIGKEFNYTDDNGTVIVPINEGIPGLNGKLMIEVVLKEHENYGTVKALVEAPTNTIITDQSTFDKRTLWSPRNKTPYFILIFTNLLIVSIWGIFIYLIINLFKISKS